MSRSLCATPTDKTLFLVLAEYGTTQIPVELVAHHFGLTTNEAKRSAARQALPIPCYRLGSQKSPWVVSADELAAHIRAKQAAAQDEWKRIHAAA
ncbi:MAG: pyocin activator PrtN family protein [Chiayiivirga sp.]|jgi:hypothetical protein|nr:pyocin activator PrtN family protein [Chiayiivirga sp.]